MGVQTHSTTTYLKKVGILRKPIGDISLELKRFLTLKLLKHLDDTQDLKILET